MSDDVANAPYLRRAARFLVAEELIVELFHMPEGTRVFNVRRHDSFPGVFEFVVEHPDLPAVEVGEIPEITPTLKRVEERWIRQEDVAWDWNLEEGAEADRRG